MADIDEIIGNFAVLDDWDDRYRYLIELGRELPPLAEAAHSDANKVQGCASQVWLDTTVRPNGAGGPVLTFAGDSDAHIVRGLIAILFAVYSGKSAREILNTDAVKLFEGMGLREHLTPQRSNGFRSMVERIRSDARACNPRIGAYVALIDRATDHVRIFECIGIALTPVGEPRHQIADRRDAIGRIDIFFSLADALTHPGEITNLHKSSCVR